MFLQKKISKPLTEIYVQFFMKKLGLTGIWTRDLAHPKRESYP